MEAECDVEVVEDCKGPFMMLLSRGKCVQELKTKV